MGFFGFQAVLVGLCVSIDNISNHYMPQLRSHLEKNLTLFLIGVEKFDSFRLTDWSPLTIPFKINKLLNI